MPITSLDQARMDRGDKLSPIPAYRASHRLGSPTMYRIATY